MDTSNIEDTPIMDNNHSTSNISDNVISQKQNSVQNAYLLDKFKNFKCCMKAPVSWTGK
jgi:hypothetical protein